jgi:hypothetical protein
LHYSLSLFPLTEKVPQEKGGENAPADSEQNGRAKRT